MRGMQRFATRLAPALLLLVLGGVVSSCMDVEKPEPQNILTVRNNLGPRFGGAIDIYVDGTFKGTIGAGSSRSFEGISNGSHNLCASGNGFAGLCCTFSGSGGYLLRASVEGGYYTGDHPQWVQF